jgi:hypothetical protein
MSETPVMPEADMEPIVIVFSDGRRFTLGQEITARIWEEVKCGRYSGPQELITLALEAFFEREAESARTSDL